MSYDLELRYVHRYEQAVGVFEELVEKAKQAGEANLELLDLSIRLQITPPFVWDELFKLGLNKEVFWERALDSVELSGKYSNAIADMEDLVELCRPEQKGEVELSLNKVVGHGSTRFEIVFGHLGLQAKKAVNRLELGATDLILTALESTDFPLTRHRLDSLKGRGFPFDNLFDGGVRYKLPTSLEAVEARLTYPRNNQFPVTSIVVKPIR